MLEGDDPLFEQDEANGEQVEIPRTFLKELLSANAPLLSTLADMESGLIHLTLTEYNKVSHKFMAAWRTYKSVRYEHARQKEAKK